MREIKFRAWRENKMHYNITTAHYEHNAMSGSGGDLWDFAEWMKWSKVMQYTGLKDKDGKEIYEGDIVKVGYGEFIGSLGYAIFEYGAFMLTNKYGANFMDTYKSCLYGEVIGNIFENSEL